MEAFLECYLDEFKEAPRNSLFDRRNRTQMVEYISTLIQGCSPVMFKKCCVPNCKGNYPTGLKVSCFKFSKDEKRKDMSFSVNNDDLQMTCNEAICTLIRYHNKSKMANSSVCQMGKYHNILYVAMKLCYLWQLKDAETLCLLLKEIYGCEETFERLVIGAIFGTKAPHYIAGWKSDFENQEENVRALVYFLDKANLGRLELPFETSLYRFIDLPIESCGKASVLKVSLQLGLPDKLLILLRFGALTTVSDTEEVTLCEHILNRLMEFNHCYPYNLVACLQLLLRVMPNLKVNIQEIEVYTNAKEAFVDKYGDLIVDGVVPLSRCGYSPPELKHLCRCVIRKKLWENFQLPNGIHGLPLPKNMTRYLDILED